MRVVIVGAGSPIPTFIDRRLRCLQGLGVDLTIVLPYGKPAAFDSVKIIRQGGWSRMTPIDVVRFSLTLIFSARTVSKLLALKKSLPLSARFKWALRMLPLTRFVKPDIIHLQWISMADDLGWLKHFYKCPIVASARGSQVTVYPLTRSGYKEKIRRALANVDYVHCVSRSIANVCSGFGIPENKIVVNYNGIDIDVFCPCSHERPTNDYLRLISVGSLIWRKGYMFQLLILRALVDQGCKVHLTVVGGGDGYEGLLYTASLLKLTDNFTLKGPASQQEVLGMLQQSDVYLSTSAAEGLSNSVLEAASCGLPVVSFDCEGMAEVIDHGRSGFIVPFGDVEAAVRQLQLLHAEPALRIMMGQAARAKVMDEFVADYWSREMVKFFKKVAN